MLSSVDSIVQYKSQSWQQQDEMNTNCMMCNIIPIQIQQITTLSHTIILILFNFQLHGSSIIPIYHAHQQLLRWSRKDAHHTGGS